METAEDILWKQYFLWKLFPWTDGAGASQALPDKKKFLIWSPWNDFLEMYNTHQYFF